MRTESIGERIKALRMAHGDTQSDLARLFGFDRSSISKWETDANSAPSRLIAMLSDRYGVSTDYILKGANSTGTHLVTVNFNDFAYQLLVSLTKHTGQPVDVMANFAVAQFRLDHEYLMEEEP